MGPWSLTGLWAAPGHPALKLRTGKPRSAQAACFPDPSAHFPQSQAAWKILECLWLSEGRRSPRPCCIEQGQQRTPRPDKVHSQAQSLGRKAHCPARRARQAQTHAANTFQGRLCFRRMRTGPRWAGSHKMKPSLYCGLAGALTTQSQRREQAVSQANATSKILLEHLLGPVLPGTLFEK